jgi:hypothetical protein
LQLRARKIRQAIFGREIAQPEELNVPAVDGRAPRGTHEAPDRRIVGPIVGQQRDVPQLIGNLACMQVFDRQVRIAGRDRHRSPEVRGGAAVVARSSIGASQRGVQVAILAGVLLRGEQNRERLLPGVHSRQARPQTDTRVDVRGMLEHDGAKPGLGFLRSSDAELQPRDPQPDLDVPGIPGDDPLEDGKRFGGSSRPGQLFCEVPIRRRRLGRHGDDERCGESNEHASHGW